jgi:nicotinamide-nucleotide amidase
MSLEPQIQNTVIRLAELLKARGWKLATAESCTGGWIAKVCTDLAGSSDWFERGFVTYSNEAKVADLEVCRKELNLDGAVSETVAQQMAKGARRRAGVEVAVAVTGIAGPGGGSAEKPVGTVWFGYSIEHQSTEAECQHFPGDRKAVRLQTVAHALDGLVRRLHSPK